MDCRVRIVVRRGGINKTVNEVILNVVSDSSRKIYNSVNKVILQILF